MKRCCVSKMLISGNAWKSKFECNNRPVNYILNGVNTAETIDENFAAHFGNTCTTTTGANSLKMNDLE